MAAIRRIVGYLLLGLTFAFNMSGTEHATASLSSSVTVSATIPVQTGDLTVTGFSSPNAFITFTDGGAVIGTTTASGSGTFSKTFTGLTPTVHTIGVFGQDSDGVKTATISFTVSIITGSLITISNFLLPPTLGLKRLLVPRPATENVSGFAKQNLDVTVFVFDRSGNSADVQTVTTNGNTGSWAANVNRTILHLGNHTTLAQGHDTGGMQSPVSQPIDFQVILSADLNQDTKVNLTDFSILMFSYGQSPPPNKTADINDNGGPPNLVDFSIMMFHFTG